MDEAEALSVLPRGASSVGVALRWAVARLERAGCESPSLDAQLLLGWVLDWPRSRVLASPEAKVPAGDQGRFQQLVREREKRVPLAYLVGSRAFWRSDLGVRPAVLIPRPETELLVEMVVGWACREQGERFSGSVVDVGTGSGAIALSLAAELPRARVLATDVSQDALAVARENATTHQLLHRVRFVQADLLAGLTPGVACIVSNPPYIPGRVLDRLPPEISRYEPRIALDGGKDGLAIYRRLVPQAARYLMAGGAIFLEVGHDQSAPVSRLLREHLPEARVERFRDLGGHWRVVCATL